MLQLKLTKLRILYVLPVCIAPRWTASVVKECCPENPELKKKIFAGFDAVADDTIVLSSSSSCISPSVFTDGLKHKAQCIVVSVGNMKKRRKITSAFFLAVFRFFFPLILSCQGTCDCD